MTERRKKSLLKLAGIADKRGEVSLPRLNNFSMQIRMPHEREVEIGERIIRQKMKNK